MHKHKVLLSLPLLAGLSACAAGQPAPLAAVPESIRAPAGESVAMALPAKGVQIYECRASKTAAGAFEWAFVAPEAELFDGHGVKVGRHYGGPTWESTDGSKVTGVVKGRADATKPGAVPWLLLAATPGGAKGAFSAVTSIQRVNTEGGVAPATGCSQATAGASARVPYTAEYYLLSRR